MRPRPHQTALLLVTLFAAGLATGCASLTPCPDPGIAAPVLAADEIDASLFLIGDAGESAPEVEEPVLAGLRGELAQAAGALGTDRLAVAFLGDNIYPAGLEKPGHRNHPESKRRLDAQIAVVAGLDPPADRPLAVFVPGNHDWHHNRSAGHDRVKDQGAHLENESGGLAVLRPEKGCADPAIFDLGEHLRMVAIDSQWLIRSARKGTVAGDGCAIETREDMLAELETLLAEAGERRTVVVAHHPLISGGPHGGTTCFARSWGLVPQDIPGRRYQQMKRELEEVFARHPPLIYAAGHDHDLQVLRGETYAYHAVSGSGSAKNLTEVGALDPTLFCREASGFMRLDATRDGRFRLAAYVVTPADPEPREVYASWLEPVE